MLSVSLTQAEIDPVLHQTPVNTFAQSVFQRQQLAQIAGAQVPLHHHWLEAAVVVEEMKLLLKKFTKSYSVPSSEAYIILVRNNYSMCVRLVIKGFCGMLKSRRPHMHPLFKDSAVVIMTYWKSRTEQLKAKNGRGTYAN